jgi:hypothetical protein
MQSGAQPVEPAQRKRRRDIAITAMIDVVADAQDEQGGA